MVDMENMPRAIGADYSVWNSDSQITLTNVPWDNNYRDIVQYGSQAEFNRWIDSNKSRNVDIKGSRHYRMGEPIKLEIPFTEAYGFNYVRVLNPEQSPVNNEAMYSYYFIIGVSNDNPGVTSITVQLDIWQTFGHLVKFGRSYIERGHIGVANKDNFNNYGRDFLTLPEGLDTGSDLKIVEQRRGGVSFRPQTAWIMVVTTTDFTHDPGDKKNPWLGTAKGSTVQGLPSGASVWFFKEVYSFSQFIQDYAQYPWILQGIQSITAIPDLNAIGYSMTTTSIPKSNAVMYAIKEQDTDVARGKYTDTYKDWRDNIAARFIPERYRHLKKFFTSPYMAIELTYFNGAPVVIKPELWASDDAPIAEKLAIAPPGSRLMCYPRKYNAISDRATDTLVRADGSREYYWDGGETFNVSTMVSNFPTFAIVANAGTLALANQAHSLAQQYKSADWSQTVALRGNETSYDQATAANNTMQANAMVGRNAAIATNDVANNQAVMRTALSAGAGIGAGLSAGPQGAIGAVANAAVGAAGTALDIQQRNANLGISNQANVEQTRNSADQANYMRDTSRALSDWAARGNYEQSIAALNAKVQDTNMTAPFTAAQAGGDTFTFLFNRNGIEAALRWKIIPPSEIKAVGEYWLRYGYAVRQFAPIDKLQVMTKFTYWKLSETYLQSTNVPEFIKQMIRGIFEKGVTVWAKPEYIGTIDVADNEPLPNISLGNLL